MQPHWRRHLLLLAVVVGSWIPVWLFDYLALGPEAGGWVHVDVRGFLSGSYMAATLVFGAATTAIVAAKRPGARFAARIYVGSLIGVIALSALTFAAWRRSSQEDLELQNTAASSTALRLSGAIELEAWSPGRDAVEIAFEVREAFTRVEIEVRALGKDSSLAAAGRIVAHSLERGSATRSVPIQRYQESEQPQWTITLRLEKEGAVANVEYGTDVLPSDDADGALVVRRLQPPGSR